MSYLLYTSPEAATGLIAQPGRAVNTFPSGLVHVDQTYLGLTANAATHRAILAVGNDMPDGDTAPCIDGLKIFPEAQERRLENGFTEYIVSAYGRSKNTATIEPRNVLWSQFRLTIIRKTVTATIVSHNIPAITSLGLTENDFAPIAGYLVENTDENTALDATSAVITKLSSSTWLSSLYEIYRFTFPRTTRDLYFMQPGVSVKWEFGIPLPLSLSQRNFGYWNEWIFAYG